jgi:RimJ/RimL family protein N-acetyltransferase
MKKSTSAAHPVRSKGRKTILRPLCKDTDLQKCFHWINDPEVTQFITHYKPMTKEQESAWFDNLKKDDVIFAIDTLDGEFIGSLGIHEVNWIDRTAVTGAMIGEKKYWGKGYGTDAKLQLIHYAFNSLNLRKLCSRVYAYNERSRDYNLHCGYKLEGTLKKQVFRNGEYHDMLLFGLFQDEFEPIWNHYQKHGTLPKKNPHITS